MCPWLRWRRVQTATPAARLSTCRAKVRSGCPRAIPSSISSSGYGTRPIVSQSAPIAPAGKTAWFLGVGWTIGDHIAITALSIVRTPKPAVGDSLVRNLRAAIRLSARDALQAEASAADTIVIATVKSVSQSRAPHDDGRTEHEELWSIVRITVDSIRGLQKSGSGKNASQVIGWVVPKPSARNMTILAPAVIGYDTAATSRLVPNEQRLLLLKKATDRPNLHNVDPTATAFIPKRSNIRDVHDITLLGSVSPNPVFGLEQQHECAQPFR